MTDPELAPLTINEFQELTHVSDETLRNLEKYKDILTQWQKKINLVSQKSLNDLWRRHMLDSAQLFSHLINVKNPIIDLGSGAGFPGLVLAIMGLKNIHLVESDNRKCTFLREISVQTNTDATIHNARIEKMDTIDAGVVLARGLASLDALLDYAAPLLAENGFCLFLKGQKVEQELTLCQKNWMMQVHRVDSLSDPTGVILKIDNVSRKNACESRP
ncbi:MAG: 16S rRNA (guanine(527)-N(7))-methyltransferase RsmG [Rhodospirillaceae bacterium]|jgi:16S rRNA (guanine527-N7)-methyltransferase|nr:16S rRNA (guanine(527)-N(7))-methyltransferase RsmG [Rhodospirillales bacterium]MBT3904679.1 16S rRNA (guanine(527)-N(7))-methyltransferase RsmG [Rhodospirillaceae bacterium]MBT4701385.1 16S rRNA (guanine(527)-N(7))-methyltransferase RsmG [Rhodospirillaceae bacterium]MBT5036213.1 16S rRNA (guanine(527)-N(7))-methyltransferase RsmG [Rhodospirillaceae bacterium]MBT6220723.1 16S rRNA (guanine(527)-N(7))-methyltransferase RsmG [Rhodospirillaceae bacterium]